MTPYLQDPDQGGCRLHHEAFTYGCPGCLDYADDLLIARQVRDRDLADPGVRITLKQLIHDNGFEAEMEAEDG